MAQRAWPLILGKIAFRNSLLDWWLDDRLKLRLKPFSWTLLPDLQVTNFQVHLLWNHRKICAHFEFFLGLLKMPKMSLARKQFHCSPLHWNCLTTKIKVSNSAWQVSWPKTKFYCRSQFSMWSPANWYWQAFTVYCSWNWINSLSQLPDSASNLVECEALAERNNPVASCDKGLQFIQFSIPWFTSFGNWSFAWSCKFSFCKFT